jgi:hypothetical protein
MIVASKGPWTWQMRHLADLRYHSEHDWTRIDGDIATFGTWFAQDNRRRSRSSRRRTLATR